MKKIAITFALFFGITIGALATQPVTCLDFCTGGAGFIHVQGWAYDPDASSQSIDVHVYVYTDAGCTSQYGDVHVLTANVSRPDVNSAMGITGDHGFSGTIAIADAGNYWVKVFAIDTNGDGNPQIGATTAVTVRADHVVTLTSETGEVTLCDGDVLTGTGGTETHITIADGATVTLSDVTNTAISRFNIWPGIDGTGNATIILIGTNAVKGGTQCPGIRVPSGYTLTIQGDGSLTATGGERGTGIGGGYNRDCGNIVIENGTITATGGIGAAGIGSGNYSSCGNITIAGGNVTATGSYNSAGIGTAEGNSSCGNITIASGVTSLTAVAGSVGEAIGKGYAYSNNSIGTITIAGTETGVIHQSRLVYPAESSNYTVHFEKNNDNATGTMADQLFNTNTPHTLPANSFTLTGYDFAGWNSDGYHYADGQTIYNLGDITLFAQWEAITYSITYSDAVDGENSVTNSNPLTYTCESDDITLTDPVRPGYTFEGWTFYGQDTPTKPVTIPRGSWGDKTFTAHWSFIPIVTLTTETCEVVLADGHTLTGTGGTETHVTIADGATVTLSGVYIYGIQYDSSHQWAGITCLGDATIILEGNNAVTGGFISAGIFVPEGKTLTIRGDGSLTASSPDISAGIGSGQNMNGGHIVIDGGNITATGGRFAAGIGSGAACSCGNITISGGTVTAMGGIYAAAIGCGNGYDDSDLSSSCGDITITGGVTRVVATVSSNASIIGTGAKYSTCGTISIDPSLIDVLSNEDKTLTLYQGLVLFDDADNATAIAANADGTTHDAQLRNHTLYRDGDWNTLTVPFALGDAAATSHHFDGTPLEGATVKTLSSSAFSNGTLTLNFEDAASIEAGKPYIVKWDEGLNLTINSTNDWNVFAENVNGGKSYAGKTVLLGADIDVSTMVGTAEYPFSGTFEGAGHTLNVSISGDDDGAAPFRYVSGATIRNVKTAGTVSGGDHSAGLVGMALGGTNHIRDCYVSASVSGGSYAGGILGSGTTSTTTISNSLFDGSLTAYNMGILYGWGEDGGTHTVENCVALGTYADVSGGEGGSIDLLLGNGTKTVTNCMKGTEVGSQGVYMVVVYFGGGEHPLVTDFLGSQWTFDNGFLLNPTVNILDTNIENPVFSNVLVSTATANVSTTYADFIGSYAPITGVGLLLDAHNPEHGAMHAALSINEPVHEGYTFNGWYTDAALTTPVTTIPFAADGTVTLYAKSSINRAITGHNGNNDGGWVFIASPVSGSIAPAAVSNLVAETAENYDFYRFNQSNTNGKEWENFKATTTENHPDFTGLVNGRGYLYANYDNVTLSFTGTFNTEATQVVPLDYDANAEKAGWNLVGNPFPVAATISNAQGDPQAFYVISGRNVVANQGSSVIEPCTGVMVKANDTGESVTFTRANAQSQAPQPNGLQIALTQPTANTRGTSNTQVDNAIVSFNEGESLEKFVFNANLAKLYIPQDHKDFAIAYAEKEGEKPLNFKAVENGSYTISVNAEGVEMAYLHLIDNLTGADVDLLATPSYTFEAKTSDYASRFRLVFKANEDNIDNNDNFAFISNGEIIVNGEGYLQVFDVLGHQLFAKQLSTLNSQLSILTAPGVYVLRLIDGEKVRTQKMVID